ncbi:MAG: branched-chain amino acid ABC transporter permease [Nitratireductor sp.]|nr:branched-chain amino acid ABC transporter permease [Nitratireductor sp.]
MNAKTVFMGYTRGDIVNFAVAIILALVIVPMVVKTDYWYSSILIPWLCLALAAVGQQIVMGYAGQLALGAAGFMAAGAFACFNLILRVPYIPFPLALVFSGLIAAAFGVLFGLPSLRVRGIYLMVATLASQFFIIWMIDKFGWFKNYDTSGIITAQDIVIFGKPFTTPLEMYLVVVVVVMVLTVLAINMTRGSTGRSWMAVRDMDIAAESMGISLLKTKLQAFAISAFFCGVAGALFAFTYLKSLEPVAFDIKLSFKILFMVILGGLGTINGAFIGAAFILLFPVLLNSIGNNVFHGAIDSTIISSIEQVVFGVLIIVFLIFEPLGMAKLYDNIKQKFRGGSAPKDKKKRELDAASSEAG